MKIHHFWFTLLILSGMGQTAFCQTKIAKGNSQQWVQYLNQIQLNEKWIFQGDVGHRWNGGFQESHQYLARVGMARNLNEQVRIAGGMAHAGWGTEGQLTRIEFRPYCEVFMKKNFKKFSLIQRYRVEDRIYRNVTNGSLENANENMCRLGYMTLLNVTLTRFPQANPDGNLSLSFGDELSVYTNDLGIFTNFLQNRLILSPVFTINNNMEMALIYQGQVSPSNLPDFYNYTNIVRVHIRHKIHF